MNTFQTLGIAENLVEGLEKQGIRIPTQIQTEIIPEILTGNTVMGQSQTGSGKTLAYVLPLFQKIDPAIRGTQAIILAPTHELAVQVEKQVSLLAENSGMPIRCALIIGGASIPRQIEKLKEKPQILVGSPGRILDLIGKRKITAHLVKTIVLDEADRLLDEMNRDNVEAVIKTTLRDRQLVFLSASISKQTKEVATKWAFGEIQDITADKEGVMPRTIRHVYISAEQREKFQVLRKILAGEKPEKTIVFINNAENIEVIADKLNYHGLSAVGIYGLAHKTQRQYAMNAFREGRAKILVASDIGARGLDVEGVTHIIHFDVPEEPVYYLHRAGRTGRKGEEGCSISIVTPYEKKWLHGYEKEFGIAITEKEMSYGKLTDVGVEKPKEEGEELVKRESDSLKKGTTWKNKTADGSGNKPRKQEWKKTGKMVKGISKVKKGKKKKEENIDPNLGFFAKKALRQAEKGEKKQISGKK